MAVFNKIDSDSTGNISLDEFLLFLQNSSGAPEPTTRASRDELKRPLHRPRDTPSPVHDRVSEEPASSSSNGTLRRAKPHYEPVGERRRNHRGGSPEDDIVHTTVTASAVRRLGDPEERPEGPHRRPQLEKPLRPSADGRTTLSLPEKPRSSSADPAKAMAAVYRKADKGTGGSVDDHPPESTYSVNMAMMSSLRSSVGSDVNRSYDDNVSHSQQLSVKHRRVVGGEAVGLLSIEPSPTRPADLLAPPPSGDKSNRDAGAIIAFQKPPLVPSPTRAASVSAGIAEEPVSSIPRSISQFGKARGVIFEGYLEKKSKILGFFQKVIFYFICPDFSLMKCLIFICVSQ